MILWTWWLPRLYRINSFNSINIYWALLFSECQWTDRHMAHGWIKAKSVIKDSRTCHRGTNRLKYGNQSKNNSGFQFLTKFNVSRAVIGWQGVLSGPHFTKRVTSCFFIISSLYSRLSPDGARQQPESAGMWPELRQCSPVLAHGLIPQAFIKFLLCARQGGRYKGKHGQVVPTLQVPCRVQVTIGCSHNCCGGERTGPR